MSTAQRVACSKGFGRQGYDLGDVRSICEQAECTDSWVGSRPIPLVGAKLDFQIPAVVRGKMGFQALSNRATVIGGAGNYRSCGS